MCRVRSNHSFLRRNIPRAGAKTEAKTCGLVCPAPAALSGTGGDLRGVVIIAGTGTVALGMDGKGRTERCSGANSPVTVRGGRQREGKPRLCLTEEAPPSTLPAGWGPAFDDRGSAHDLGSRALAAVARAVDGRGPETLIQPLLLEHLVRAAAS